jgi:hypothetical protein
MNPLKGESEVSVVFIVQHLREDEEGYDATKLLGVYSTQELAEAAADRYRQLPGFAEHAAGFGISGYELDKDSDWLEGFVDLSGRADSRIQLP